MTHLEDNFSCLKAYAMELLPRRWWEEKYMNDTPLLLLDMTLRLRHCLNTGSCPLPRNSQVRQWPQHLEQSVLCFQFYKSHPAVVEHLTDGIARNVDQVAAKLRARRTNLVRTKVDEERTGITGFDARIVREMCNKCNECGMLGPVGERLKLKTIGGTLACSDCHDDNLAIHVQPENLAERRRAVCSVNVNGGQADHLVALRAEHHTGHVLFPANVMNNPAQASVTEGRMDEEYFTVMVPTTVNGIKRLNEAAKRASEEWMGVDGLKAVAVGTEAPRTLFLQDFPMLLQDTSALHRAKLAQFNRAVVHRAEGMANSAIGEIERSPKKIRASYGRVEFESLMAGAMKETLSWSDGAVAGRICQSEARRACNGRVKSSIEVRILADEPVHWSQSLKVMIVKTFERDVTDEGSQTLMCAGGCTPASCNNEHPQIDKFLEENMVGLARLARIPVVLTYLKVALAAFEKAILLSEFSQWDFNLKFDKKGWNVSLVGSAWTRKRVSLNKKIARRTHIKRDIAIVKRILLRPEDMETVTLDRGHLQTR